MARKPVRQAQKIETVPAPIGGINARDAISIMPETDAVSLINWIPDTYGIRSRKGYREWTTNIPNDEVPRTIMSYMAVDTPIPGDAFLAAPTSMPGKLFMATDEAIYDITDSGDPVEVQVLSALDNAGMMSHAILSNIAGSTLCAASETDGYFTFNGTAWAKPVEGTSAGEIEGIDPSEFCFLTLFKNRLWFVQRDSTSAWYLPTEQITGKVTKFDFGAQFRKGGFLAYLANWTIDAGTGVDDFLVAVSSNGEVVVYKGTDPSQASTFGKVGTFFVGQVPVGRRGFLQYGGDLVLISANGIYPMSFITRGGAGMLQASQEEYSSKIRSPLGEDLRNSFTLPGWCMAIHPSERILIVGVPDYGGQRSKQFVMSASQNQWTVFAGIPAFCYGECLSYMFAGTTDGRVVLLFTDPFDDVKLGESGGLGIRCEVHPAFSYFKAPALEKQFLMVRPTFLAVDEPISEITMSVNFAPQVPRVGGTPISSTEDRWNVALWNDAQWAGASRSFSNWITVGGVGYAGAVSMSTECAGATVLVSLDYMFQSGGPM